jgi:TolB-like protein
VAGASRTVFISYASQDAAAAAKIAEALRTNGIEVFLDQSELRGGDAWDEKIRREIQECAIFIAVISANTASRHEGYFRLEWDLADQRSHMIARSRAFIVPVCLDSTTETAADVPASFKRAQWTRLPGGATPFAFVERIRQVLSPDQTSPTPTNVATGAHGLGLPLAQSSLRAKRVLGIALAIAVVAAFGLFLAARYRAPKQPTPDVTVNASAAPASRPAPVFSPPPHSIAVLPFVNMSGDKDQEYFSDGLTEELLNALAEITELQVAARTSAFSFKGTNTDIGTIARKLNVGTILEGSVRRSAHTIRISTELIDAASGFHLWSRTYDRNSGDILQLQSEIATSVAGALKVTLLTDTAEKIELGGTTNPAAFDAYLKGRKADQQDTVEAYQEAISEYTQAIKLDPRYALAFAARSLDNSGYAIQYAAGAEVHETFDKALADARQALALAPELVEAHLALAVYFDRTLDFARAIAEFDRTRALGPGNAQVLRESGRFAVYMGHADAGLTALRQALALDPLNPRVHFRLTQGLYLSRHYEDAIKAANDTLSLDADYPAVYGFLGLSFYELQDFDRALASCGAKPEHWNSRVCLAVAQEKLHHRAEADAQLAKLRAARGDYAAYQYAEIAAQWGDTRRAFEWLDAAMRVRDAGLVQLKIDPLMDPLRSAPRFQALMLELKFPN